MGLFVVPVIGQKRLDSLADITCYYVIYWGDDGYFFEFEFLI
jgi:hypothetical protein